MFNSDLLCELYKEYDIANLKFGTVGDKLGDVYEKFIVTILQTPDLLSFFNANQTKKSLEYEIFCKILYCCNLTSSSNIIKIKATSDIGRRTTGGLSKTDVIATIHFKNGNVKEFPLSIKQSTVAKVAFAEFDVKTIINEVKITDDRLIYLLEKHQVDKSAKNFTKQEKEDLKNLMSPIAKSFVRWVITGSPNKSDDLRIPVCVVKLQTAKQTYNLLNYNVYNVDEYINHIMIGKNGEIKLGGFGTGLSWTYATGSGGKKIQFKG